MKWAICTALFVAAAACDVSTDPTGAAPNVRGEWKYAGKQTAPYVLFSGTLRVTEQHGASFEGTAVFQEASASREPVTHTAVVSGAIVGGTVLDFDVMFDDQTRRHVGSYDAESMSGTWARTDGEAAAGRFTLVRAP